MYIRMSEQHAQDLLFLRIEEREAINPHLSVLQDACLRQTPGQGIEHILAVVIAPLHGFREIPVQKRQIRKLSLQLPLAKLRRRAYRKLADGQKESTD